MPRPPFEGDSDSRSVKRERRLLLEVNHDDGSPECPVAQTPQKGLVSLRPRRVQENVPGLLYHHLRHAPIVPFIY